MKRAEATNGATAAAACLDLVQVYESAGGPVHALRGVSAEIPARRLTTVLGPSGAGKSTFLRLLACLERPTVGEVLIDGERTAHLSGRARRRLVARRIGYVFQTPTDNLLDYLTVREHVRLAWRMRSPEPPGAVGDLLELVGLANRSRQRPASLAAGEQQRLAFAMAVAARPALVIADEPTASLDPDGASALVMLLPALLEDGQTLVICTHDPTVVTAADKLLVLNGGTLAAEAGADGELHGVIDDAGRVALPREIVEMFPDRRVRISAGDRDVRMSPP